MDTLILHEKLLDAWQAHERVDGRDIAALDRLAEALDAAVDAYCGEVLRSRRDEERAREEYDGDE